MTNRKAIAASVLGVMLLASVPAIAAPKTDKDVVREARDRDEIEHLAWRYARALDTLNAEAYAATYTPDGAFGQTKGHDALFKMIDAFNHPTPAGRPTAPARTGPRACSTGDQPLDRVQGQGPRHLPLLLDHHWQAGQAGRPDDSARGRKRHRRGRAPQRPVAVQVSPGCGAGRQVSRLRIAGSSQSSRHGVVTFGPRDLPERRTRLSRRQPGTRAGSGPATRQNSFR